MRQMRIRARQSGVPLYALSGLLPDDAFWNFGGIQRGWARTFSSQSIPERDTPDVLKSYLENFDSRIVGLTGDLQKKAEALAETFRVCTKKVMSERPGDYTVDHTGVIYLMDKRGRFVGAFNLQRPPQQAARELENYL
jgi:hypothetical protein